MVHPTQWNIAEANIHHPAFTPCSSQGNQWLYAQPCSKDTPELLHMARMIVQVQFDLHSSIQTLSLFSHCFNCFTKLNYYIDLNIQTLWHLILGASYFFCPPMVNSIDWTWFTKEHLSHSWQFISEQKPSLEVKGSSETGWEGYKNISSVLNIPKSTVISIINGKSLEHPGLFQELSAWSNQAIRGEEVIRKLMVTPGDTADSLFW